LHINFDLIYFLCKIQLAQELNLVVQKQMQ
jgi:hypothetical protein